MRRWKSLAPVVLITLAAVVWCFYFGEPIAAWLSRITNRSQYNGHVVGKVMRSEGSTRVLHLSDIQLVPSPTEKSVELRDVDRLQTSVDSKAIIILNSQDELEIGPSALVQFQLWNPKDPSSPIYIRSSLGDLRLLKAGVKGRAYLVRDGRLYLPGQKPLNRPMALTVLRSAPLDLSLAENQPPPITGGETTQETQAVGTDSDAPDAAATAAGVTPDTLSNEYIDETISGRQGQLQKCWLTRLKDAPQLKGHIVLQFEITRRGRVKDVRISDASLDDDTLTRCVISVISRITFRQYRGPEISLSYPITFE